MIVSGAKAESRRDSPERPLFHLPWLVDDLVRVEELMRKTVSSPEHALVADAALHLIQAGGKRLRPALVMMSSRAGTPAGETDLAAAAVELVHIATLYHDDVIDETEVRRGVPTVHSKWGIEIAVLAGDFLFARGCALGAEAGGDVPAVLARGIGRVCEGQILETATASDPNRTIEDYMRTVGLKTAALFEAACELGASTSRAGLEARNALAEYGRHLGTAFQVVDDLLDLVGDPLQTGKEPGSDLREGVFTLPVLLAAAGDPQVRTRLERGERVLDELLPSIRATGALREARNRALEEGTLARRAIAPLGPGEWQEALATVVEGVLAQVEPALV
ncbi:MAG: polyprenyl synthetase family protein [Actinomycetota bacterium]|nr:polyprenyl synthetase family protein [Actinomycetota bacterium]